MNVLMFGWEFPPHNSGGLGTACHGLTRAMARKQDLHVKFVLPRHLDYSDDWIDFVFAGNGTISEKIFTSPITPYMTPTEYIKFLKTGKIDHFSPTLIDEVYRYATFGRDIAEKTEHDVIHAHEWLSYLAGVEARKAQKKPFIAHVHSTEYDRSGGNVNPEVHAIEEEGLRKADKIIAVSQYTKNIITHKYKVKDEKIEVVHNGVHQPGEQHFNDVTDNEILRLKKLGYSIVLYAGRLTLHKGPDYFLQAAKLVTKFNPKTIFVIAGSGDMEYKLVEMTAQLGLSKNVIFTGWLRGQELSRMFASADVYVLPSVSEPFGIAPLEAITYGTPVIVSRQSGVSEALFNALKVDFWDIEELASLILSVTKFSSLKQELTENSMKEVSKFTWDAAAQHCLHVYNSVL